MVKRIVIDGPPGSGKTTLIFGRGSEDPPEVSYDSLISRGFEVFGETGTRASDAMIANGKNPLEESHLRHLELILRMVAGEIGRYCEAGMNGYGLCFFDRGLPGYKCIGEMLGIKTPPLSKSLCKILRYDDPIFVLEPISDFDLSAPRPGRSEARILTMEQRIQMHEQTVRCYERLGYDVLSLPYKPSDKGTTPRIERIIAAVNGHV